VSRYREEKSHKANISTISYNPSISLRARLSKDLGISVKVFYNRGIEEPKGGEKRIKRTFSPSLHLDWIIARPGDIRIPGTRWKLVGLKNELELDVDLKANFLKEKEGEVLRRAMDEYTLKLSGSYDLQKSTEGTLGASLRYCSNKLEIHKSFFAWEAFFRVEFKF
jgi:hypothetical protein